MWDYSCQKYLAKKIYWCGKKKVPVLVVVWSCGKEKK